MHLVCISESIGGGRADQAYPLLKGIAVFQSCVFHFNAVVGDGVRTVTEQLGDLSRRGDAQQDQCEDTHLYRHALARLRRDTRLGFEQRIEILHFSPALRAMVVRRRI